MTMAAATTIGLQILRLYFQFEKGRNCVDFLQNYEWGMYCIKNETPSESWEVINNNLFLYFAATMVRTNPLRMVKRTRESHRVGRSDWQTSWSWKVAQSLTGTMRVREHWPSPWIPFPVTPSSNKCPQYITLPRGCKPDPPLMFVSELCRPPG